MVGFVKTRGIPAPGSIPDVLQMFRSEVRFYREIAPVVGVRVPACYEAVDDESGTRLVLEDLSAWAPGAEPIAAAGFLAALHRRWEGRVSARWPWLRRVGDAAHLVADLFDRTWPDLARRTELTSPVRALGSRLIGRIPEAELAEARGGPLTLAHGDASARNLRTGPRGEIALLDWEDVRAAPGVCDLAWLLLSSVEPSRWDEVVAAYGPAPGLPEVLPSAACQGFLSLADTPAESAEAEAWVRRLDAAARQLAA